LCRRQAPGPHKLKTQKADGESLFIPLLHPWLDILKARSNLIHLS
jgi:hypothetical protein